MARGSSGCRRPHRVRLVVGKAAVAACSVLAVAAARGALQAFCGSNMAMAPRGTSRARVEHTSMRVADSPLSMLRFADPAKKAAPLAPDASRPMTDSELAAYMQQGDFDASEVVKSTSGGLPILDWLPTEGNLTAEWIFTYVLLPFFGFFLLNFFTTPLQDKLMGEDIKYDFSGKNSRIKQIFAESGFGEVDPNLPPIPASQPSDMPAFGTLEEVRRARAESGGVEDFVGNLRESYESVVGAPAPAREEEAPKPAAKKEESKGKDAEAKDAEAKDAKAKDAEAKPQVREEAPASP